MYVKLFCGFCRNQGVFEMLVFGSFRYLRDWVDRLGSGVVSFGGMEGQFLRRVWKCLFFGKQFIFNYV